MGTHPAACRTGRATGAAPRSTDALDLIDWAIDALANTDALFAALDPEGMGIFDHYDDGSGNMMDFIYYDATGDRRWETTGNNRALSAFLGEREYKVIASLGTTDYTRFGVWYRIGAVSAERWSVDGSVEGMPDGGNGAKKGEGGPGSFASSPLDPTMAGTASNPVFPTGGSASFVGETVAIMDEDVLTGTAKVDVSWASAADLQFDATRGSNAGMMSVTLGDIADATGDPLAFIGKSATGAGYEIAEIVFSDLKIMVGGMGPRAGQLIVGDKGKMDADGNITYGEATVSAQSLRYRLSAVGMTDEPGTGGDFSLGALFAGQGVEGPLGVIGTWTLKDSNVARVNASGAGVEEGSEVIRGAFGTDIP